MKKVTYTCISKFKKKKNRLQGTVFVHYFSRTRQKFLFTLIKRKKSDQRRKGNFVSDISHTFFGTFLAIASDFGLSKINF